MQILGRISAEPRPILAEVSRSFTNPPVKFWDIISDRPHPLPSTSYPIHYSLLSSHSSWHTVSCSIIEWTTSKLVNKSSSIFRFHHINQWIKHFIESDARLYWELPYFWSKFTRYCVVTCRPRAVLMLHVFVWGIIREIAVFPLDSHVPPSGRYWMQIASRHRLINIVVIVMSVFPSNS